MYQANSPQGTCAGETLLSLQPSPPSSVKPVLLIDSLLLPGTLHALLKCSLPESLSYVPFKRPAV
eukprot:2906194-Rhodomonas_salina.2